MNAAREQLSLWGVVCGSGRPYTAEMVYRVLTNQTYLGLIEHQGEYHEGNFQPLISKALFEAVQARLKERSQPRKSKIAHDFPFMGVRNAVAVLQRNLQRKTEAFTAITTAPKSWGNANRAICGKICL